MRKKDILLPIIAIAMIILYFATGKKSEIKTEYLLPQNIQIKSINYIDDDLDITFEKSKDNWLITKPENWPANQELINKLMSKLKNIEIISKIDTKDDKNFEFNDKKVLKLKTDKEDYTIFLGKKDKSYRFQYVKLSDKIYLVDASFTNYLPLTINQIKDKTVYNIQNPKNFSLKTDNETIEITFDNETSIINGKNIDKEKTKKLIELITKFESNTFADNNTLPKDAKKIGFIKVKNTQKEYAFELYKNKDGDFYIPYKNQVFEIYSFKLEDWIENIKKLIPKETGTK
ncbi:DUF4340 domain-containing protein [Deferribacter thermophilus]|uniref:DUF4340 domain-containing protein n=1 Tax=Deferribacter thermophilus TaxID=53573 RepID=UPI003C1CA91C